MASTGILNGTIAKIQVAGVTVAHLTSNSLTFDMATRDASTKDSAGWKESLEGQRSFSGSGEGFFAEDATYGFRFIRCVCNTCSSCCNMDHRRNWRC